MFEILSIAKAILNKTDDFWEFAQEYNANILMHGERLADGAVYVFNIAKDYTLVVCFLDGVFNNFSIVHKSVDEELLMHI